MVVVTPIISQALDFHLSCSSFNGITPRLFRGFSVPWSAWESWRAARNTTVVAVVLTASFGAEVLEDTAATLDTIGACQSKVLLTPEAENAVSRMSHRALN